MYYVVDILNAVIFIIQNTRSLIINMQESNLKIPNPSLAPNLTNFLDV